MKEIITNFFIFDNKANKTKNEDALKLLDTTSFKELHRIVIKEYLRRLKWILVKN